MHISVGEITAAHRARRAGMARPKLQELSNMASSGTFNGHSMRTMFAFGVRSTADWGSELGAGIFNTAEWNLWREAACILTGIEKLDTVPHICAFNEAGIELPGVAQLCKVANFLENIRNLPDSCPAKVALIMDVKATYDIPADARVKLLSAAEATSAKFLLCKAAATMFAAWQWAFSKLGLQDFLGGIGDEFTHAPWEPRPVPAEGEPPLLRGETLIRQKVKAMWGELLDGSESAKEFYKPLMPEQGERWMDFISQDTARDFKLMRLGAIRLHEHAARRAFGEVNSMVCRVCQVNCTYTHVLTACKRVAGLRAKLRGTFLSIIEECAGEEGIDGDVGLTELANRVRTGIRAVDGIVPEEKQEVWRIFLLGGPAEAPAPFAGYGASCAMSSVASSRAATRMFKALPRFVSTVVAVVLDRQGDRPMPAPRV